MSIYDPTVLYITEWQIPLLHLFVLILLPVMGLVLLISLVRRIK